MKHFAQRRRIHAWAAVAIGMAAGLGAVADQAMGQAPAGKPKVTYEDQVLPIFRNHCNNCHNPDKAKGDLDLSTFNSLMKGGGSGEAVKPADAEDSLLWKLVSHAEKPSMPPMKPKLPDGELAVIRNWIEGGLLETSSSKAKVSSKPKVDLSLKSAPSGKPTGPVAMPENLMLEPVVVSERGTAINAMAHSPWGPVVALGGQKQVVLYNSTTMEYLGVLPFKEGFPRVLRFSRNGSLLIAGGGRGAKIGRVVVWDVKTGKRLTEVGEEYDQVMAADISSDQSRIALGGPGKLVKIFDISDGSMIHSIKKHTEWVTALSFSPDGVLLASGDRNGGLHVWEAKTGNLFYTLNGHQSMITDVTWRADSNVVASASEDGRVMTWNMENGDRIRNWSAHNGGVLSAEYAHDGRIVTTGRDRTTKVWDGNGAQQKAFEAFGDLALKAVFNHDDTRVIGADWSGQVKVWDAKAGSTLGQLVANPPGVLDRVEIEKRQVAALTAEQQKAATELAAAKAALAKSESDLENAKKAMADASARMSAAKAALAQMQEQLPKAQQKQGELTKKLEQIKREVMGLAATETVAAQSKTRLEELTKKQQERDATAKNAAEEADKAQKAAQAKAGDKPLADAAAAAKTKADEAGKKAMSAAAAVKEQAAKLKEQQELAVRLRAALGGDEAKALASAQSALDANVAQIESFKQGIEQNKKASVEANSQVNLSGGPIPNLTKAVETARAAVAAAQGKSDGSAQGIKAAQERLARWEAAGKRVPLIKAQQQLEDLQDEQKAAAAAAQGAQAAHVQAETELASTRKTLETSPELLKKAQADVKQHLATMEATEKQIATLKARTAELTGQRNEAAKQVAAAAADEQAQAKAIEAAKAAGKNAEKALADAKEAAKKSGMPVPPAPQQAVDGAVKALQDLVAKHKAAEAAGKKAKTAQEKAAAELAGIEKQLQAQDAKLKTARAAHDQASGQLMELQTLVAEGPERVKTLEEAVKATQAQAAADKKELDRLNAAVAAVEKTVADLSKQIK